MNNVRKPLTGLIALGMALAMPMAFAQEADEFAQEPAPTQQAAPQGQVSWADLDTDGDGNLSRQEAAALPELASIFDQADADGDGNLTPQEYQQYAASQGAGSPPQE
ncbi:EF-hand domain-containing protein [Luteimonas dalianensis]|uniref:EF-hand domain-containing protein n=1 Tax=Luteimonas dalianensis TaxID=1148196 RepID=UPI003BF3D67B